MFYFEATRPPDAALPDAVRAGRLARIRREVKRNYARIEDSFPMSERLCSHLRLHDQVVLHVPSAISPDTAERMFLSFLQRCVKKHRRWWYVDGLLAAGGAALFWFPGPNVFFFYPALRALAHRHAVAGGEKHHPALRAQVHRHVLFGGGKHRKPAQPELTIRHSALLDDFSTLPLDGLFKQAGQIEKQFGYVKLKVFLEKKYGNQQ